MSCPRPPRTKLLLLLLLFLPSLSLSYLNGFDSDYLSQPTLEEILTRRRQERDQVRGGRRRIELYGTIAQKSYSKQALHAIEASGRSERGEESDNIQARSSSSSAEESPLEGGGGGLSGLDPSGILHREKRQSRRRGGNRWGSRRSRERNLCGN